MADLARDVLAEKLPELLLLVGVELELAASESWASEHPETALSDLLLQSTSPELLLVQLLIANHNAVQFDKPGLVEVDLHVAVVPVSAAISSNGELAK